MANEVHVPALPTLNHMLKREFPHEIVNTFPHSGLMKFRAVSNSFATLANQSLGSNPRDSVFNPCLSPFWTDFPHH